jgi:hypothetical protein
MWTTFRFLWHDNESSCSIRGWPFEVPSSRVCVLIPRFGVPAVIIVPSIVFWLLMLYSTVKRAWFSSAQFSAGFLLGLLFNLEDESSMFLEMDSVRTIWYHNPEDP